MISWLRKKISYLFIKEDPKAHAFDSFYRELFQSRCYQEIARELQGHPHPPYNLSTPQAYKEVEKLLKESIASAQNFDLLDWGCGSAPLLGLLELKGVSYLGVDFSAVVLDFARKKFPTAQFLKHHQNFGLPQKKSFHTVLAIDSLYPHRPSETLHASLSRALRYSQKELIILQNIYRGEAELPQFPQWERNIVDLTADFKDLIASWQEALQRPEVISDSEKYPLLWGTISQEMAKHQRSLNAERNDALPQKNLFKRYLIHYSRKLN